jgi:protein-ribulosamine 3-kinase
MTVTRSSVKEVIPDVGGDFELDQGVIAELPEGSTVVEASSFGTSAWTRTARIRVQLSDGSQKAYFLKVR